MTTLRLYNTLTRSKEDFVPLDPTNVRMYVCGPTVYDFAHIGNARPAIVFDVLFRLLRHIYGADHVTYVRNITDIDDKINARALERRGTRNVPILDVVRELTQETYRVYQEDVVALGCLPPTNMPRATEYVPQMIAMTQALIDAGFAYPAEGHVLFDVEKKKDYGKLARRSTDDMIAGARVDVAPYKKNPMDFVLWKPSDDSTPGWDSPWGRGRPGWHLECSSMIEGTFAGTDTIDIHGGGIDLVFPHHENEIAQSEGAHHDHPLANVWMHNGFLNVEGEKMSKSLGNFVTIRELLNTETFGERSWTGGVLRLAMLKTHYRQPIDWTLGSLQETDQELAAWVNALSNSGLVNGLVGRSAIGASANPPDGMVETLSDDLNTPDALTFLRELFTAYTKGNAQAGLDLAEACDFLGLLNLEKMSVYNPYHVGAGPKLLPPKFKAEVREVQVAYANSNAARVTSLINDLAAKGIRVAVRENGSIEYEVGGAIAAIDKSQVQVAIDERLAARARKDFKESDRIRDELLAQGIVLKDEKDGTTTWAPKR